MIKPINKYFLTKDKSIEVFLLKGIEVKPFIDIIANFRLSIFKEFPYLYSGTIEGEREYLKTYFDCKDAYILLVYDNEDCVGFTSAIPFIYEDREVIDSLANKIDIEKYLYIGECILLPAYQNKGIAKKCLKILEDIARKDNFSSTIVASVYRDNNHPLKPTGYTSIDIILSKLGYTLLPEISVKFKWTSSYNGELSDNTMLYYSKNLLADSL